MIDYLVRISSTKAKGINTRGVHCAPSLVPKILGYHPCPKKLSVEITLGTIWEPVDIRALVLCAVKPCSFRFVEPWGLFKYHPPNPCHVSFAGKIRAAWSCCHVNLVRHNKYKFSLVNILLYSVVFKLGFLKRRNPQKEKPTNYKNFYLRVPLFPLT